MHDISSVCIDDVQPDDSVSQTGVDDDPAALEVNKKMKSSEVLAVLKKKIPIAGILASEKKYGRMERNVQPYLKNSRLDPDDSRKLRAYLKLVAFGNQHANLAT